MDLQTDSILSSLNYKLERRKSSEWDTVSSLMFGYTDEVDPEDHKAFVNMISSQISTSFAKYTILFSAPYTIKKYGIPMTSSRMLGALGLLYVGIPLLVYLNEKETFVCQAQQILVLKYLEQAKQKDNQSAG